MPLEWRTIVDRPRAGAENMALDHALALSAPEGEGVLRLYGWARPTASFGRNEPARGRYSSEAASDLGIDFVRRPTGGRVVLHDDELTYALVAPMRAMGGARAAYRSINEALARALASLGAGVSLAGATTGAAATLPLDAGPCFQSPAPGEVTALGRKMVGSAQARLGAALLQHGSIIISGDQSRLDELRSSQGERSRHDPPVSLSDLLGPVPRRAIIDAIVEAMHRTFGGEWVEGDFTTAEMKRADRLLAERYGTDDWTWRR